MPCSSLLRDPADAESLQGLEEQLERDHVKQIHWGLLNSRTALAAQEVLQILIAGSWESRLGKSHRRLPSSGPII